MQTRTGQLLCTALAAAVMVLPLVGCESASQGGLLSQFQNTSVSESQLQSHVDQLVARFTAGVETAAAKIYYSTESPATRASALRWAIGMNLECIRSNNNDDAYANMVDVAALSGQQLAYFSEGEGRELFGDDQHIAVAVASRLCDEAISVIENTLGDASDDALEKFTTFVDANPIEGLFFTRRSTTPLVLQMKEVAPVNVFSNLRAMDRGVQSIGTRLEILTDQLPKQIIWQAELMVAHRFDPVLDQASRSLDMVETLPDMVATEREAILAAVSAERQLILADIDRQRRETLVDIESMVRETTASIDRTVERAVGQVDERVEESVDRSLEMMSSETDKALTGIERSLIGAIGEVDVRIDRSISEQRDIVFDRVEGFIDRIFLRILQVGGIAFVVVVVVVFVLRRSGRAA